MTSRPYKAAWSWLTAPFRRRPAVDSSVSGLARRMEQRALYAVQESQAYADRKLADQASTSSDRRHVEERSRLAVEEAVAYTDNALQTLALSLRGLSNVVLELGHRVTSLEARQSENSELGLLPSNATEDELARLAAELSRLEIALRDVERQAIAEVEKSRGRSEQ